MTRTGLHTVEIDIQLPHNRVLLVIPFGPRALLSSC